MSHLTYLLIMLLLCTPALGQQTSPLQNRLNWEEKAQANPFTLTPHKPTYLLPLSYNDSPNNQPFDNSGKQLDRLEVKFQISLKFLVWRNLIGARGHLFFGYTQQSYWQAFQRDNSSPFRETNHEPEAILFVPSERTFFGFQNRVNLVGLSHQSNGRTGNLSRSWNRLYVNFIFEREHLAVSLKPWWRIPEDSDDDDNPDIVDYMGHGELSLIYKLGQHNVGVTLRHNLDAQSRGAMQLDWSFPIYHDRLNGYLQYFNGYGENLIDYDDSSNRLSVGIILTDWI
jgi:phospholipase A1